jgi:hypothetical protein
MRVAVMTTATGILTVLTEIYAISNNLGFHTKIRSVEIMMTRIHSNNLWPLEWYSAPLSQLVGILIFI